MKRRKSNDETLNLVHSDVMTGRRMSKRRRSCDADHVNQEEKAGVYIDFKKSKKNQLVEEIRVETRNRRSIPKDQKESSLSNDNVESEHGSDKFDTRKNSDTYDEQIGVDTECKSKKEIMESRKTIPTAKKKQKKTAIEKSKADEIANVNAESRKRVDHSNNKTIECTLDSGMTDKTSKLISNEPIDNDLKSPNKLESNIVGSDGSVLIENAETDALVDNVPKPELEAEKASSASSSSDHNRSAEVIA